MALFKQVNGKKIQLSAEEETNILAEWAANDAEKQANEWSENRENEYPDLKEKVNALFESIANSNQEPLQLVKDKIVTVDSKYPQPQ